MNLVIYEWGRVCEDGWFSYVIPRADQNIAIWHIHLQACCANRSISLIFQGFHHGMRMNPLQQGKVPSNIYILLCSQSCFCVMKWCAVMHFQITVYCGWVPLTHNITRGGGVRSKPYPVGFLICFVKENKYNESWTKVSIWKQNSKWKYITGFDVLCFVCILTQYADLFPFQFYRWDLIL